MSASHPKITFKVFERTLPESLDNATFNMMLPVEIVLRRGDPAWNRTPEVRPAVRPAASEPEGGRPKRLRFEPGVWSQPYEQNPPAELVGRLMQALPIVEEDSLPTGPSAAGARAADPCSVSPIPYVRAAAADPCSVTPQTSTAADPGSQIMIRSAATSRLECGSR